MTFFVYDRPIGSSFAYNDNTYEVIESPNDGTCKGCSLEHDEKLCTECPFYCTEGSRLDRKNVIFKSLTK